MARKNENGKWIIAAGEVAEYTVCPEAWRLSLRQRRSLKILNSGITSGGAHNKGQGQVSTTKPTPEQARSSEGQQLHEGWASDIVESQKLIQGMRFVMLLLAIAILIFVLSFGAVVHA